MWTNPTISTFAISFCGKQVSITARRWHLLLFAAIVLLAGFLRLYRLDQLPPGLHYDEAFNAVQAQKVLSGAERPLYFTGDLTEEPMAIYVASVSFGLFGASPWSLRLVSALVGVLTVAAVYALAREMFRSAGAAALSAFLLAILYWHVNFSRLGMEPVFLPLMLTLAVLFLWRGLESGGSAGHWTRSTVVNFVLAGLFFAATQYTYKGALMVPVLLAAFVVLEFLLDRGFWTRDGQGLLILVVTAVLVFAPLGLYFVAHPGEFLERPATVTAASGNPATVFDNALRVAGMLFVRGDENPRSNLPGRPALDLFLAVGFMAGLIGVLVRFRRDRVLRFLLLWLLVMSLPSVLTDFAPHFGRSIGTTPAIALLTAFGFASLVERVPRLGFKTMPRVVPVAVLAAGLAASTFSTFRDYFVVWGSGTGLFESFDVGYLNLATRLRALPPEDVIYLSPVPQDNYTIQFGLDGRPGETFDGRHALVLPPPGAAAAYGVITREDARSLGRLMSLFPNGQVAATLVDFTGQPYATIWTAHDPPRVAPSKLLRARVGDSVELIGYDLARDGNALALTLYWGCIGELREDYTVFAHLLGAPNPATQSPVWAQDDARPGHGSYPTVRWQPGQVIVDDYRLVVPPDAPPGAYQIEIGMYTLQTGVRARITDANGVPMENDRVLFETISLP